MLSASAGKILQSLIVVSVALNVAFLARTLLQRQRSQARRTDRSGSSESIDEAAALLATDRDDRATSPSICRLNSDNSTSTRDLNRFNKTLRSFLPPPDEFDKSYRNPCWFMQLQIPKSVERLLLHKAADLTEEDGMYLFTEIFGPHPEQHRSEAIPKTLYCIPKVYFIGFPKSGSTQVYKMLMEHPLLVGGHNKEPHWWTKFHFSAKFPNNLLAVFRYLLHYKEASEYIRKFPQALAIDGSQSTIWDTRAFTDLCALPALLASVVPTAKYIVIMREPIDRLYSDFAYLCEDYWEKRLPAGVPRSYLLQAPDMFHEAVEAEIAMFENCLTTSSLETCTHYALSGKESTKGCGRVRLGISMYYVHISRWLRSIPKEHFLFLRTDDLAKNPYGLLQEVWSFLALPEQSAFDLRNILFEHRNTNQVFHIKSVQMLDKTRLKLHKFFRPFNEKLVQLLTNENFLWLDV